MTLANLQRSIKGIDKEIRARYVLLTGMRIWYNNPLSTTQSFTMRYFYREGPKALREMNKLISIREELKKLIDRRLEETRW